MPRIAIAHDYLTQRGGAERVVLTLAERFPDAPIHTTLYDPDATFPEFRGLDVRPTVLNAVPTLRHHHRLAFPLLAAAVSATRIDADLVIASSSGWAHGFGGAHLTLVYCHSPARWLHCGDQYLAGRGDPLKALALRTLSSRLRRWDRRSAWAADHYLVNSTVVRDRVAAAYGLDATVVPAPVAHALVTTPPEPVDDAFVAAGDYFLCVSRLMPYKNVDRILEAFRLTPDLRLVVVGRGPEWDRLVAMAPGNVHLLRDLSDGQLRTAYARSQGLVAASFEDYGLTPLEAAAFGRPSVVLRAGGYLDTMVDDVTAVFFDEPTPEAISRAVRRCAARAWRREVLLDHARGFGQERFLDSIQAHVRALLSEGARPRLRDVA